MEFNGKYQIYPELAELGLIAGVTLKNSWASFDDVYSFVRNELVPPNKTMIVPKQVHGADIAVVESNNSGIKYNVDGAITKDDDLCLTVTTADCIPVLFADPISGLRAAVHIGWRCFIGGIIENYFEIAENLGAKISETRAVIGPGIESCCFEVGPDVAILFDEQYIRREDNACYVDLRRAVWNKIEALGVVSSNISSLSECTSCFSDKYYSFRRDKDSPIQMVSFIFNSAS